MISHDFLPYIHLNVKATLLSDATSAFQHPRGEARWQSRRRSPSSSPPSPPFSIDGQANFFAFPRKLWCLQKFRSRSRNEWRRGKPQKKRERAVQVDARRPNQGGRWAIRIFDWVLNIRMTMLSAFLGGFSAFERALKYTLFWRIGWDINMEIILW